MDKRKDAVRVLVVDKVIAYCKTKRTQARGTHGLVISSKHFGLCLAGAIALVLVTQQAASANTLPDYPAVTTVAGSGVAGIKDGPADVAQFVAPVGLAVASNGDTYIADRDAQRIRVLGADGTVRTLAGSGEMLPLGIGVPGGFQNGSAHTARFSRPLAVAVMHNGDVIVADSGNHCLRRVHGGVVTTFAGKPGVAGDSDGRGDNAEFSSPMSLAVSADGTLYVADFPNGVRRVSADGTVTTLRFQKSESVTAVAITAAPERLLASSVRQIFVVSLNSGIINSQFETESLYINFPSREGGQVAGPPAALLAYGLNSFVWTDPLKNAVRLGQMDSDEAYTRVLNMRPREDADTSGGGFRDGPGDQALFNAPYGIARTAKGAVLVADSANHRIRRLSSFDDRTDVEARILNNDVPAGPGQREYRIGIVGNSYIGTNVTRNASFSGVAQQLLLTSAPDTAARAPVLYPIERQGMSVASALDMIDNELGSGIFDMVILDLPTYGQLMTDGEIQRDFATGWQQRLAGRLLHTRQELTREHVRFFVLIHPGARDFPTEATYRSMPKGLPSEHSTTSPMHDPGDIYEHYQAMKEVLGFAGVDALDLYPMFANSENSANHRSLFGTWDHHFTVTAHRLVGEALATRLLQMRPWSESRH